MLLQNFVSQNHLMDFLPFTTRADFEGGFTFSHKIQVSRNLTVQQERLQ